MVPCPKELPSFPASYLPEMPPLLQYSEVNQCQGRANIPGYIMDFALKISKILKYKKKRGGGEGGHKASPGLDGSLD